MIISASRRTDIPACFPDWFQKRLAEGFCYVRNPFSRRLREVSLLPETLDAILFWTKNAGPMLPYLEELDGYRIPYGFQYTITPYETDLEKYLDKQSAIAAFETLSERLGPDRVFWRYDPVIITEKYPPEFHTAAFERLCERFSGLTGQCTFSFADTCRNAAHLCGITDDEIQFLAGQFSHAAGKAGMKLFTCAEPVDLSAYGISRGSCIGKENIEKICGYQITAKQDTNQRVNCGCIESIDIGTYGTCRAGCAYCYAQGTALPYDPASPILCGTIVPDEPVLKTEMKLLRNYQTKLFI
jgi:hypothetical protein